jgi:hypothetical protein
VFITLLGKYNSTENLNTPVDVSKSRVGFFGNSGFIHWLSLLVLCSMSVGSGCLFLDAWQVVIW